MKKLMKLAAFAAAAATLLVACNKEKDAPAPVPTDGTVMKVTIPDALTKVSFTDQTASDAGMALAWEAGDAIRVISGSASESFAIKEGFSGHVAEFTGNAVSGSSFDVIYPGTFESLESALAHDYAGQTQTGNGSTAHLKYNAALVGVDTYEQVAFIPDWATTHGGTLYQNGVLKLVVTLPEGVSAVTRAALSAESEIFVTDNAGAKKALELAVALENVDVSADGGVLTAYMNIPAVEQAIPAGTTLAVNVTGADGTEYTKAFEVAQDVKLQGGKLNTVRLTAEGPEILSDYFVTVAGAGDKTGADWENAMGRDELVTLLSSGDADLLHLVTIHMAAGEYYLAETLEGNYVDVKFADVTEPVALTVKGGYPANLTGRATTPCDPEANVTILSGNKEKGILTIGAGTLMTFDGLTFKDASNANSTYGALCVNAEDGGADILNCRFIDNINSDATQSGSAVILLAGGLTVTDSYFSGNHARNAGALLLSAGSDPVAVSGSVFENNTSVNTSGAVQNAKLKDVTFTNCEFKNNMAYDETVNSWGGGAFHTGGSAETTFVGCTFTGNKAKLCGGAISLEGATVTCTDCTFTGNSAEQGDKTKSGQNNTAVSGNTGGGAIILRKAADVLTLNNCTFTENNAPNGNGGAIGTQDVGAQLIINEGTTFSGNTAFMHGGAIFAMGDVTIKGSSAKKVVFRNNITQDTRSGVCNGGAIYLCADLTASVEYALFSGNESGIESGSTVNYSNGGAISMRAVNSFTLDNSEFTGNRARNGGCLNLELGGSSICKVTNCNFHDNINRSGADHNGTSGNFSGAVARLGGGTVEFENCVFTDNVANNASAVLHMNADNVVAKFTDCQIIGNECRGNNVCIKMEKAGEKLYMNHCLFEGNHGASRGMINPAASTTVYLNDVSFKDNYTTANNGWGVAIHSANSYICMNNVTGYNNYCTNTNPGSCASFNSDGGWLVTNSTIVDNTPLAVLRQGGSNNRKVTVYNSILINRKTAGNVIALNSTANMNDAGHNVLSYPSAPSGGDINGNGGSPFHPAALAATDLIGQTDATLNGSYEGNRTTKPYYGVYSWANNLTGFSPATASEMETVIKGYADVGETFYNWLVEIGEITTDGRGVTRTGAWWPGAYQN